MQIDPIATEFKQQTAKLLDQAVEKIQNCLQQIDGEQLWWRPQPRLNSIGNLLLHMSGNLRQWSTVALCGLTDERDRAAEFSADSRMEKQQLLNLVVESVQAAQQAIAGFPDERLVEQTNIQGFDVSFLEALMHTSSHFQGHTQQVILLSRLILDDNYRFHWSPDNGRDRLPM